MQQELENIIERVSKEKGLPFEVVKAVYYSQFQVARKIISSADIPNEKFQNIRFKHLGLLYGNLKFIQRVNRYRGTGTTDKYVKKINKNK
jgi:hypothetical protein